MKETIPQIDILQNLARNKGGVCLSMEFKGVDHKYRFRCAIGHEWDATFRKIVKQGTWCSKCAGLRPDKVSRYEEAKQVALSKGGELQSTEYRGTDALLCWRCAKGHEWKASFYNVVIRGTWCGYCVGRQKNAENQLNKARETAILKGGICLSKGYKSSTAKLSWRCAKGHEWDASYSNTVSHGKWCPWCAGNKVDLNEQLRRARETARAFGGELLSDVYVGNKAPMRWRCAEGHEWDAAYNTVVNFGSWCGRCRGTQRDLENQLEIAHKVAANKGGKCLSNSYVNNSDAMLWQCERNHTWKAAYYSIVQAGSWCPTCSAGLKERLVRHALEELFGKLFKKHRPIWLRNPKTGRLMELDGYNNELSLAFEYQGEQHYKAIPTFKMEQTHLEQGRYRDNLKRALCQAHSIVLLEVPYTVDVQELPEWLSRAVKECKGAHRLVPLMRNWRDLKPTEWIESDHYSIDDLRKYASTKGGECITETYLGSREKHQWRCAKGHEWYSSWDSIHNNETWCPVCCGNIILEPLQELQQIAKFRGGELISTEYLGAHIKHRWRCSEGHEWEAKTTHIKSLGSWCPVCSGRLLINPLQQLQIIAEQRGGKCLSDKYVNSTTRLRWRCKEAHEWESVPSSIKSGRWCPFCATKKRIETRRKGNPPRGGSS